MIRRMRLVLFTYALGVAAVLLPPGVERERFAKLLDELQIDV